MTRRRVSIKILPDEYHRLPVPEALTALTRIYGCHLASQNLPEGPQNPFPDRQW